MPANPRYSITRVITPADSMELITLDQAKAALGIPPTDTSQDAKLTAQIASVSAAVNNYCNRVFVVQTYQDQLRYVTNWLYPGQPIRTRQFPLIDPLTVTQDGTALDPTALEVSPSEGAIYRLDGALVAAWTGTSILVDYTAGFDPIPADVQGACLEWVMIRYRSLGRDPTIRSETIPDLISQTFDSSYGTGSGASAVPPTVSDFLTPYKVWMV